MFHSFNKDASYDILNGKIILESIDSNMNVSQNNYNNIKVFNLGYSSMFGQSKLRLFYVKEIGLIKRYNIDNGDDWEMIDYKTYY